MPVERIKSLSHWYRVTDQDGTVVQCIIESLESMHLPDIRLLDQQLYISDPGLQLVAWDEVLASPQYTVYGLSRYIYGTKCLVGYLVIRKDINEEFTTGDYTICHIAIQKEYRQQGYARNLMAAFAACMYEAYSSVKVEINRSNSDLKWWQAFGFIVQKLHLKSNIASMQVSVRDFAKALGCLSDEELASLAEIPELYQDDQDNLPQLESKDLNHCSVYEKSRVATMILELLNKNVERLEHSLPKYKSLVVGVFGGHYTDPLQTVHWLRYKKVFGGVYIEFFLSDTVCGSGLKFDSNALHKLIKIYMQAYPEKLCLDWCLSNKLPREISI